MLMGFDKKTCRGDSKEGRVGSKMEDEALRGRKQEYWKRWWDNRCGGGRTKYEESGWLCILRGRVVGMWWVLVRDNRGG